MLLKAHSQNDVLLFIVFHSSSSLHLILSPCQYIGKVEDPEMEVSLGQSLLSTIHWKKELTIANREGKMGDRLVNELTTYYISVKLWAEEDKWARGKTKIGSRKNQFPISSLLLSKERPQLYN